MNRIYCCDYIFTCGCRNSNYIVFKNHKLCEIHRTQIESKVRWCYICGKECHVSKMCNSVKYRCEDCRPIINHRVRREYQKRNPAPVESAQEDDTEKQDFRLHSTFAVRILEDKFPPPVMPEWSPAMASIINAR